MVEFMSILCIPIRVGVNCRRKVLVNQVEQAPKQIMRDTWAEQEIEVEEMETDQDPIHLLISMKSQPSISLGVKSLKGHSAR